MVENSGNDGESFVNEKPIEEPDANRYILPAFNE